MQATSFPYRVQITKGEDRTKAQNKTIHKWFGEIAAHLGDTTTNEVKADKNLIYGKPILMRDDPEWASVFGYLFDALSLPAKLKAIRVLDVPFTRRMNVPQLNEYMDQLVRDTALDGIHLTIPEDKP